MAFASDASFYRLVPQAVARPRDLDEVAALFAWSQRHEVPLVFRAGGTSLSGQSITDGVLVDVSLHWRGFTLQGPVEDPSAIVSAQPGVIGGHLNLFLQAQGRKIGPDPASIQSCMVGGIVANNASGMCCGVHQNSYHTLDSLVFMLPDGQSYDTALFVDQQRFAEEQSTLCETLLNLRQQLLANSALGERIRRKYLQKNTTGYSLNAFLDFEDPLAIFSHLFVHPVCSLQKMNLAPALTRIAERCAHRVSVPLMPTCCGTAGDRGLLYPELTQAALAEVELQLNQDPADMLCASSRSCEMGISLSLDREVLSIAHIMYAALQDAGEVSKDNPQRSPGRSLERDPERNKESEN